MFLTRMVDDDYLLEVDYFSDNCNIVSGLIPSVCEGDDHKDWPIVSTCLYIDEGEE